MGFCTPLQWFVLFVDKDIYRSHPPSGPMMDNDEGEILTLVPLTVKKTWVLDPPPAAPPLPFCCSVTNSIHRSFEAVKTERKRSWKEYEDEEGGGEELVRNENV